MLIVFIGIFLYKFSNFQIFRMLCGRRVRVELSSGKSRSSHRPPPRYNNEERCYECGERGHYARDCKGARKRSR